MGNQPLLSRERIRAIHSAAISLGLAEQRDALVAGLPARVVAMLPDRGRPDARLLRTLYALNALPGSEGGEPPLAAWLQNARLMAADRPEDRVFVEALRAIKAGEHSEGGGGTEERRRAGLRMAALGFAVVLVAGAVGATWHRLLRTDVSYAADYILRGGALVPVGPIDPSVQARRWVSYRIESRNGRVLRVARVNGRGAPFRVGFDPTLDGQLPALSENLTEELDESDTVSVAARYDDQGALLGLSSSNRNGTLVKSLDLLDGGKRVFSRDAGGLPLREGDSELAGEERELDGEGRIIARAYINAIGAHRRSADAVYGVLYALDGSGLPERETFVDAEKKPLALRLGEAIRIYRRDGRGEPLSLDCFDAASAQTLGRGLYHRRVWDRDADGNVVEERSYDDANGRLAPDGDGVARRLYSYRGGLLVEVRQRDVQDKPVPNKDGWARVELDWDERGREKERRYYDADNRPTPNLHGCSRITRAWDEAGNETGRACFGRDGHPAPTTNGSARVEVAYDRAGHVRELRFLDGGGAPVATKDGYARVTRDVDPRGRETRWAVFGADGGPGFYNGYSYLLKEYDERGYQRQESYYDAHGDRAVRSDYGAAIMQMDYDERGHQVRERLLDARGAPVVGAKGYARIELDFDERGNPVRQSFWGPGANEPVLGPRKCHRVEDAWDERGNLSDQKCLDTTGNPSRDDGGIFWMRYARDARGDELSEEYRNPDGSLVIDTKELVAKVITRFDARGRLIEKEHRDAHGHRTLCVHHEAGERYGYDARGNKVELVRIGLDGRAVAVEGTAREVRRYDDWGRIAEEWYLDAEDQPAVDLSDRSHRVTWEHDARGNRTAISYYGLDGPIISAQGCHRREWVYGDQPNATQETCLDTERHPLAGGRDGVVRKLRRYERGLLVELSFVDGENRPTRDRRGIARITYRYDSAGRQVEERYWDEGGGAATDQSGRSRIERKLDPFGRALSTYEYGPGHETRAALFETRRTWNARGNDLSVAFFDGAGARMNSPELKLHRVEKSFDEFGRQRDERYLDASERPARGVAGTERVAWRYDDRSREIERSFTRADGTLMENSDGNAYFLNGYDEQDRLIERRFYGADKRLKVKRSGYAMRTVGYDARGLPEKTSYFDARDPPQPVRIADGYAEERRSYDSSGLLASVEYRDEHGQLINAATGFARMEIHYDPVGSELSRAFFGAQDEPLPRLEIALVDDDTAPDLVTKNGRSRAVVAAPDGKARGGCAGLLRGDVIMELDGRKVRSGALHDGRLFADRPQGGDAPRRLKILRYRLGVSSPLSVDLPEDLKDCRFVEAPVIIVVPM